MMKQETTFNEKSKNFSKTLWILATSIGTLLGIAAVTLVAPYFDLVAGIIVCAALFGVSVGTMQWLVLRINIDRAGWWIPVNIVSWIIGTAVAFGLYFLMLHVANPDDVNMNTVDGMGLFFIVIFIVMPISLFFGFGVVGMIQWAFLRRHFKRSKLLVIATPLSWIGGSIFAGMLAGPIAGEFYGALIIAAPIVGVIVGITTGSILSSSQLPVKPKEILVDKMVYGVR